MPSLACRRPYLSRMPHPLRRQHHPNRPKNQTRASPGAALRQPLQGCQNRSQHCRASKESAARLRLSVARLLAKGPYNRITNTGPSHLKSADPRQCSTVPAHSQPVFELLRPAPETTAEHQNLSTIRSSRALTSLTPITILYMRFSTRRARRRCDR